MSSIYSASSGSLFSLGRPSPQGCPQLLVSKTQLPRPLRRIFGMSVGTAPVLLGLYTSSEPPANGAAPRRPWDLFSEMPSANGIM